MKKTSGAERRSRRGGQKRRGRPTSHGGGVEVKAEQGELVVLEGGDRVGEGDEDGDGDEVQV